MTALTLPSASTHSNGERMWLGSPARTVAGDGGHPISSAGHTSGRLTGRSRCIGVARPFPRSPTSRSLPFRPGDRQSQLPTPWRANRRTTRKRIRISRRFRRSLDYAPASGRPMRLGLRRVTEGRRNRSSAAFRSGSARAPLRRISVRESVKAPGWASLMTLLSDTAYHSFIGEVEALNTTTIRRLTRSRRHQLLAIAHVSAPEELHSGLSAGMSGGELSSPIKTLARQTPGKARISGRLGMT